jgi:hypothetical protein
MRISSSLHCVLSAGVRRSSDHSRHAAWHTGAKETGWFNTMNENLLWMLNFIFSCRHRNLSRPFTCSRRTYEVCLGCGRHFPYSLETMSPQRVEPPQDTANTNLRYRIEQPSTIAPAASAYERGAKTSGALSGCLGKVGAEHRPHLSGIHRWRRAPYFVDLLRQMI